MFLSVVLSTNISHFHELVHVARGSRVARTGRAGREVDEQQGAVVDGEALRQDSVDAVEGSAHLREAALAATAQEW